MCKGRDAYTPPWPMVTLEDVAQVIDPHPSHRAPNEVASGIPFAGIGDINEYGDIDPASCRIVPEKVFEEHRARYSISQGDIGFGRVATIGKIVRLKPLGFKYLVSPTLAIIKPEKIDANYLFYSLKGSVITDQVDRQLTGTTRSSLGIQHLRVIRIPYPDVRDQEAIGRILDTLDTQIQKTEALIAKLEKVKEGLLHDLLTRGIDENGQLRPSPEQAPELYKKSPLGLIPREWEVKRLGGLIDGIDAGWSPSCSDVAPKEGEWGVLKVSAISTGSYIPHKSKTLPDGLSPIKEIEVNSGDVICVRANGVADLVGKTAYVFSTPRRLMLSDKTLRLRAGKNLDPLFLFLLMGSTSTRKQIASLISGSSGQKNLSQNQITSIQVKAPSIEEQARIAGALSSMNSRIEQEKSSRDSSAILKTGLMDDLLTGRVRVTPLLDQAQATTPA